MGEMLLFCALSEGGNYVLDVFLRQLVIVRNLDALVGRIDKQRLVVCFAFLQHHDAGGNGCAEEQVAGKLDDAVDKVVVNEVLSDFLLCAAAIHDTREADDRRRAVRRKPRQRVHDKGKVSLGFRGKHAGGSKTRIVYECDIIIARPFYAVRRIYYYLEWEDPTALLS